jgi:di/tricarboxylate transporter
VTAYAALGIVPAQEFYRQIEWPIIVMLACLLPLGAAFESVGGTALIANWITTVTAGQSPVVALVLIMVVTMVLSDALNNVATIVIAGPVAIDIAQRLGVNPDTFLMGVAIAASCAFLTPIGHKNNTLIMGPGGFGFSDYWQMGLPLELVVLVVSVPLLLIVWPL